jgi:hypothetical protein
MPHEFTEFEEEPQTQSSARRSGGPPRKHAGAGVLDPDEDTSAGPASSRFAAFLIVATLAIMILIVFLLNR